MVMVKSDRFIRAANLLRTKFSVFVSNRSKSGFELHSNDRTPRLEPTLSQVDSSQSRTLNPLSPLAQNSNLSAMTTRNTRQAPVLDISNSTEAV